MARRDNPDLPPRKCRNCRYAEDYGSGTLGCLRDGRITTADESCPQHRYTRKKFTK